MPAPAPGYVPAVKQILIRSLGGDQVDYNPERVLVDDFTLDDPIVVRPGDRVRSIEGVVDYSFGTYKLQPVEHDVDAPPHPLRTAISTRRRARETPSSPRSTWRTCSTWSTTR